jgi:hypothetical protein
MKAPEGEPNVASKVGGGLPRGLPGPAVFDRVGPPEVVRVVDVEKPVPRDGQVLVRVRAASLNSLEAGTLKGRPYFARLLTACANRRTPARLLICQA